MRLIPLILLTLTSTCAFAQFDPKANLHGDTLRTWRSAPTRDQMATITDIVVKILNISDPLEARSKAIAVHACVGKTAADFMAGERRVADVAVSCIAQLGYLR